jgi:hypothetical protein
MPKSSFANCSLLIPRSTVERERLLGPVLLGRYCCGVSLHNGYKPIGRPMTGCTMNEAKRRNQDGWIRRNRPTVCMVSVAGHLVNHIKIGCMIECRDAGANEGSNSEGSDAKVASRPGAS